MRLSPLPAALLAASLAAGPATAAPLVVGRVGLVASGALAPNAIAAAPADDRALVTVRIPGGSDALRRAGFDAQPLAGDVAALRATADDLRRLLANPDVLAVEERRLLHPLLDASGPAIGAPAARAETGLDGTGALVAVVDTGVDFRHADLRHADGTTRVTALLDLAHPRGTLHPELPDYAGGAVWLRDDIDATLAAEAAGQTANNAVLERDTNGHGTHVIGITASNGLATAPGFAAGRYVGVAPGADIVAVQATRGDASFTDADVITGCRFALDEAALLGRPVVVNLSLGGPGGPHDGTTDLELALDALFPADTPGRVLVIAAGNEASHDQHAGGWALDGHVDVPIAAASSGAPDSQLALELWYDGAVSITVVAPSGKHYGPVAPGTLLNGTVTTEGQVLVDNGSHSSPRADGRRPASIAIVGPKGGAPAGGTWTIVLDGSAHRWDLWITDDPNPANPARFVDRLAEDDSLDLPAAAHDAITVGSFVTRNQWPTVDGTTVTRTNVIGAPSSFSSTGPTADGRFAPDLIAPGEYIVSALSQDASPDNPSSAFFVAPGNHLAWADDGLHAILRGTSQAAPHVAGAIALLFQAEPTLTPAALRELLRVTAHDDARGYTPRFGFGKLDVLAALRYLRGARAAAPSASASSVAVSRDVVPPGDDTTIVTVTPRGDDGTPLGAGHAVTISASAGEPVGDVIDTGFGRYERTFAAHASRGSHATISVVVDGVALDAHPSVFFVDARADIGAPFAAGGGCSLSRTAPPLVPILLVAAAALLAAKKSRRRGKRRTLPR